MPHEETYDAILLGAGGAGLLLLDAMRRKGWLDRHRVLVVEPDAKVSNDRTWCFWTDEKDELIRAHSDVVTHVWSKVDNGLGRIEHIQPYRYAQIRSLDFYQKVMPPLQNHPSVDWLKGTGRDVTSAAKFASVWCGDQEYRSKHIFDSRPFSREESSTIRSQGDWLWQSFVGYRVRASQIFDPETCTLMDFNVPQGEASQFIYTLPTSKSEALIELTRFGATCLNEKDAAAILSPYISAKAGEYEILEVETGRIPMTLALNPKKRFHPENLRVIPIGTRAGAVKSTTGYAFKHMATHAENTASALLENKPLPTAHHALRAGFYDRLLMRVLSDKPHLGKKIFQQLFQRSRTSNVLRFLDEKTNIWQEVRILAILPYLPFLRALAQQTLGIGIKSPVHSKSKLKITRPEIAVVAITLVFLILNAFAPNTVTSGGPWFLLAGLIFPGIPHGAVDHWVSLGKRISWKPLIGFVSKYLLLVAAIAGLWWISPTLGLIIFLLYSAWHFGETDLRDWQSFSAFKSGLWGISVLGTILFGHYADMEYFLSAYGAETLSNVLASYQTPLLMVSVLGLFWTGWLIRHANLKIWAITTFVILSGLMLPLLLAFALYFIGFHSVRGWSHLLKALHTTTPKMVRMALPFSLGAWILGGLLWMVIVYFDFPIIDIWPLAFVWIAAISGPHVLIMHGMYRRLGKGS